MAEDSEEPTIAEQFDAWYNERRAKEKADADKAKRMKDLGLTDDILDAFADRVWARGEERAAERRKADEDADQEPARGKDKPTGVERLFGIGRASGE